MQGAGVPRRSQVRGACSKADCHRTDRVLLAGSARLHAREVLELLRDRAQAARPVRWQRVREVVAGLHQARQRDRAAHHDLVLAHLREGIAFNI